MTLAMAAFTMNDAGVKTILGEINGGQIMLVRGALSALLIMVIARFSGGLPPLRDMLRPMVLLRLLFECGATVTFLAALSHLPLSNLAAIMQSLPLAVTLGAALFLREPVGWRRWSAIIIGFIGVLVIIRPGAEGFSSAAIFALMAVCCAAGRDLATKRIHGSVPALAVSLVTTVGIALLGGVLIEPMGGWKPFTPTSFAIIALTAVLLLIAQQTLVIAMRTAEISFVAPFRYTGLIWGILLGFAIFEEGLDFAVLIGGAIVIVSGIYSFYRENRRAAALIAQQSEPRGMA